MDEAADDLIRRELAADEQLIWAGRPRQGFLLRQGDVFLIPFSLLWGGFAISWEVAVIASGAPWTAALFGLPFVLIGLYFLVGRFWVDDRQRAVTRYAITSQRIVIVSGWFDRWVKSLSIDTISEVSLTERRDGSGIITFGSVPLGYWWYAGGGWPGLSPQAVPCFELAAEARQVFDLVRQTQRDARSS